MFLLKREKSDPDALFMKLEIGHGIKKMSQTKMQKWIFQWSIANT